MRTAIALTALILCFSMAALSQATQQQKAPAAARPAASAPASPAAKAPASAATKAPASQPSAKPAPAAAAPKPAAAAAAAPKEAAPAPKPDPSVEAGQKALQELQAAQARRKKAEDVVHEWFRRWNALDGKEETINKLMELVQTDATFEVGPNEHQKGGSVLYEGDKLIRKMVEDFTKTWSD